MTLLRERGVPSTPQMSRPLRLPGIANCATGVSCSRLCPLAISGPSRLQSLGLVEVQVIRPPGITSTTSTGALNGASTQRPRG
jgi:hypothetical protein